MCIDREMVLMSFEIRIRTSGREKKTRVIQIKMAVEMLLNESIGLFLFLFSKSIVSLPSSPALRIEKIIAAATWHLYCRILF